MPPVPPLPPVHVPELQVWPGVQSRPQSPQFDSSELVSTQAPSQNVRPPTHSQLVPAQIRPPVHALLQAPQCCGLLVVLVQPLEQSVCPEGHSHSPATQL
jgi:hypothetical protein